MIKLFHVQLKIICNSWYYKMTGFIVCIFVLANHIQNVAVYIGKDYYQLHDGVKLLLLSNYSESGFYFVQIFPVLAILPAGFSFIMDRKNKSPVFISARSGVNAYYKTKIMAIFSASFLVFVIPLILEMILSFIAFPVSVTADPGNVGLFEVSYISKINAYPLSGLFVANRWIYMLLHIVMFGFTAGVLNVFTAVLSTCYYRFPVLLFLPSFLILYLLYFVNLILPGLKVSTYYFFYLQAFHGANTNYLLFILFLCGLAAASYVIILKKARESDSV